MARKIRMRIEKVGDDHKIVCLIKHPMETGNRVGPDGNKVPIHYIQYMNFFLNGEIATKTYLGPGVSLDPLIATTIKGAKAGDTVSIKWGDSEGETGEIEKKIKG